MRRYVLDTSVVIAWYLPEAFSARARVWQSQAASGTIAGIVPALHYWEFGNVLRSYVRRHELSAETAREIYALHLDAPLELADPARDGVLERALEYGATVYDAVFIELALQLDVPLVTAEKSTTPWVVRLGKNVELVR